MIEARLECRCGRIMLPDLDLEMVRGQVMFMDASKAKGSQDLHRAWLAKAVSLKYVERFRERREVSPVSHQASRPKPVAPPPETPDILLVDPEEIADRVAAELGGNLLTDRVRVEVLRQMQECEDRIVSRVVAAVIAGVGTTAQPHEESPVLILGKSNGQGGTAG